MSEEVFEALQNHVAYSWICFSCGIPNFAPSFFDSTDIFDLSNSFEALNSYLASSDDSEIVVSASDVFRPTSASSPKATSMPTTGKTKLNGNASRPKPDNKQENKKQAN